MLEIEYDAFKGEAVKDAEVEMYVLDILARYHSGKMVNTKVTVGSELVIQQFRLSIVEGLIDCNGIVFVFQNNHLKVNKFGVLDNWPRGFCDYESNLTRDIIRNSIKKRKDAKTSE